MLFEKSREKWTKGDYLKPIEEFKKDFPDFKYGWSYPRSDFWKRIVMPVRVLLSYRRFLNAKDQSQYFKERVIKYLPYPFRLAFATPLLGVFLRKVLMSGFSFKLLSSVEKIAGVDKKIFNQIKDLAPDVVIVTAGDMRYGSMDLDYIKAAQALKIPTVVSALSWDSLSSKALIQFKPDILLAWNEEHVSEAWEHHDIAPDKTRIIGSPMFDSWFSKLTPSTTKEEFCKKYGLDPTSQILLYLGSPSTITLDERPLIKELLDEFNRSQDNRIRNIQIIMRPHPAHSKIYQEMDIPGVKIVPKTGALPDLPESLQLFYDSLYHSVCAVGVNTSAMLEVVIAGKPVVALLRDEYKETQSEAQHFKVMKDSGALYLTKLEEFSKLFGGFMDGVDPKKDTRLNFVKKYIRPRGLGISAGESAVLEIEKLCKKS